MSEGKIDGSGVGASLGSNDGTNNGAEVGLPSNGESREKVIFVCSFPKKPRYSSTTRDMTMLHRRTVNKQHRLLVCTNQIARHGYDFKTTGVLSSSIMMLPLGCEKLASSYSLFAKFVQYSQLHGSLSLSPVVSTAS